MPHELIDFAYITLQK